MNIFSEEQLAFLCRKWQNFLSLSHWDIAIRVCRARDMSKDSVQATNEISLSTERAIISILSSEDYPNSPFEQDMEISLVHELLHIHLQYITEPDINSLEYIHLESFIERLARLLVGFVRQIEAKNNDDNS